MVTRKDIATKVAKKAALAAYNAVMNAPMRKVATIAGVQNIAPSAKEVAKIAAVATYKSIVKMAQVAPPPNSISPDRIPKEVIMKLRNLGVPTIETAVSNYISSQGDTGPINLDAAEAEWPTVAKNSAMLGGQPVVDAIKGILKAAGANIP
jgi:hypothetical protein